MKNFYGYGKNCGPDIISRYNPHLGGWTCLYLQRIDKNLLWWNFHKELASIPTPPEESGRCSLQNMVGFSA
jgi:hypothetical protein